MHGGFGTLPVLVPRVFLVVFKYRLNVTHVRIMKYRCWPSSHYTCGIVRSVIQSEGEPINSSSS